MPRGTHRAGTARGKGGSELLAGPHSPHLEIPLANPRNWTEGLNPPSKAARPRPGPPPLWAVLQRAARAVPPGTVPRGHGGATQPRTRELVVPRDLGWQRVKPGDPAALAVGLGGSGGAVGTRSPPATTGWWRSSPADRSLSAPWGWGARPPKNQHELPRSSQPRGRQRGRGWGARPRGDPEPTTWPSPPGGA